MNFISALSLFSLCSAQQEHRIIRQSRKRKEANVRAHSKPGTVPYEPERRSHTVKEEQ